MISSNETLEVQSELFTDYELTQFLKIMFYFDVRLVAGNNVMSQSPHYEFFIRVLEGFYDT